jgi:DNA-binding winged helix-turn-helix (wHTH) protein
MDLEFGNYHLKRTERLLLGPNGPVELSGRSFDILATLLGKPDEVIGKTELFDSVWPGVVERRTRCRSTFRRCENCCRPK